MNPPPRIYALIVAAGTGSRAGEGTPKQYRHVAGKPLLTYSCEALASHPAITGIQVVIHPDHAAEYKAAMDVSLDWRGKGPPKPRSKLAGGKLLPSVIGGAARSDSVRAGLTALAHLQPDYVLIHDAARPFLSHAVIEAIIAKLSPEQAVVPALPVVDTVRRYDAKSWSEIPRDGLLRIQTPQAFPFLALQKIYARATAIATDDAAIWLAAGLPLVYVEGEERLRKVTTAADMDWAEDKAATGTRRIAVGMGTDVHQLMPAGDKHIIRLGGIDIPHDHKLHGHSDADAVLHAVVDAILGALAEGDIGMHFSPTDERWKGADSRLFVEETRKRVIARGGVIQHLDVTVICESPKIGPHREAMQAAVAAMLKLPLNHVSIKATTTEKLGFTGRSEGIAAQAVATISLPEDA